MEGTLLKISRFLIALEEEGFMSAETRTLTRALMAVALAAFGVALAAAFFSIFYMTSDLTGFAQLLSFGYVSIGISFVSGGIAGLLIIGSLLGGSKGQ